MQASSTDDPSGPLADGDRSPARLRSLLRRTIDGPRCSCRWSRDRRCETTGNYIVGRQSLDRKSTRLNSSHGYISYAVFCLKKKTQHTTIQISFGSDLQSRHAEA